MFEVFLYFTHTDTIGGGGKEWKVSNINIREVQLLAGKFVYIAESTIAVYMYRQNVLSNARCFICVFVASLVTLLIVIDNSNSMSHHTF